jgi:hypothetical protein
MFDCRDSLARLVALIVLPPPELRNCEAIPGEDEVLLNFGLLLSASRVSRASARFVASTLRFSLSSNDDSSLVNSSLYAARAESRTRGQMRGRGGRGRGRGRGRGQ